MAQFVLEHDEHHIQTIKELIAAFSDFLPKLSHRLNSKFNVISFGGNGQVATLSARQGGLYALLKSI